MNHATLVSYFENLAINHKQIKHVVGAKNPKFFALSITNMLHNLANQKPKDTLLLLEPPVRNNIGQSDGQTINWTVGFFVVRNFQEPNYNYIQHNQIITECDTIARNLLTRIDRDNRLVTGGISNQFPIENTSAYLDNIKWLRYLVPSSIEVADVDPALFDNKIGVRAEFVIKTPVTPLDANQWEDLIPTI